MMAQDLYAKQSSLEAYFFKGFYLVLLFVNFSGQGQRQHAFRSTKSLRRSHPHEQSAARGLKSLACGALSAACQMLSFVKQIALEQLFS